MDEKEESEMEKIEKLMKSAFEILAATLMVTAVFAFISIIIWFIVLVWSQIFNIQM